MDTAERVSAPALVRVEEAARRMSISRAKAYELIGRGELRSVRIDGSRRVRVSDLNDYIDGLMGGPQAA